MGRIGSRYAELVRGIGAGLVYASPSPKPDVERRLGARRAELEELLGAADAVSLHAPGGEATRHLIDAPALALMKPDAILVNAARGSLVDSAALAAALREGRIGGAGLDVFEDEPEVPTELIEAPGAVLLPHIGSATRKARDAMARTVAENVIAALAGREPPNLVG
jgi:glyoxylate reductase